MPHHQTSMWTDGVMHTERHDHESPVRYLRGGLKRAIRMGTEQALQARLFLLAGHVMWWRLHLQAVLPCCTMQTACWQQLYTNRLHVLRARQCNATQGTIKVL
jgi:hypothetical protein